MPQLARLTQYLSSFLKHQQLNSRDHRRLSNAISPLAYAKKLENQHTQREQKSAEKNSPDSGCLYYLTLSLQSPFTQVMQNRPGQFVQPGKGGRWTEGGLCCYLAPRDHPFASSPCFILLLQYKETCGQTNCLIQKRCGGRGVGFTPVYVKGEQQVPSIFHPEMKKTLLAQ